MRDFRYAIAADADAALSRRAHARMMPDGAMLTRAAMAVRYMRCARRDKERDKRYLLMLPRCYAMIIDYYAAD